MLFLKKKKKKKKNVNFSLRIEVSYRSVTIRSSFFFFFTFYIVEYFKGFNVISIKNICAIEWPFVRYFSTIISFLFYFIFNKICTIRRLLCNGICR